MGLPLPHRQRRPATPHLAARARVHAADAQTGQRIRRTHHRPQPGAGVTRQRRRHCVWCQRREPPDRQDLGGARRCGGDCHRRLRLSEPGAGLQCAHGGRPADGGRDGRRAVGYGVLECVRSGPCLLVGDQVAVLQLGHLLRCRWHGHPGRGLVTRAQHHCQNITNAAGIRLPGQGRRPDQEVDAPRTAQLLPVLRPPGYRPVHAALPDGLTPRRHGAWHRWPAHHE